MCSFAASELSKLRRSQKRGSYDKARFGVPTGGDSHVTQTRFGQASLFFLFFLPVGVAFCLFRWGGASKFRGFAK